MKLWEWPVPAVVVLVVCQGIGWGCHALGWTDYSIALGFGIAAVVIAVAVLVAAVVFNGPDIGLWFSLFNVCLALSAAFEGGRMAVAAGLLSAAYITVVIYGIFNQEVERASHVG